ncbi:MAG: hypothetical protein HY975_00565 [Candidatus Kerfeldbacteria bacterium]|nr:hypothetical protein [Candidatus Kerfeldbacteria bacterium]
MARFTGRKIDSLMNRSTSTTGSVVSNMASQLMARRGLGASTPKKIIPPKPMLSTAQQKEGELKRMVATKWLPSGLRLARLRQMAAKGKILGGDARDFLTRSNAGKKLQTSESIMKLEKELLRAAKEVTADRPGRNPLKYQYRKGGEEKIEQQAKTMFKELKVKTAEEAKPKDDGAERSRLDQRRDRLNSLFNRIAPAPGAAPAAAAQPRSAVQPISFSGGYITPLSTTPVADHLGAIAPLAAAHHERQVLYIGRTLEPGDVVQLEQHLDIHLVQANADTVRSGTPFARNSVATVIDGREVDDRLSGVMMAGLHIRPRLGRVLVILPTPLAEKREQWLAAGATTIVTGEPTTSTIEQVLHDHLAPGTPKPSHPTDPGSTSPPSGPPVQARSTPAVTDPFGGTAEDK